MLGNSQFVPIYRHTYTFRHIYTQRHTNIIKIMQCWGTDLDSQMIHGSQTERVKTSRQQTHLLTQAEPLILAKDTQQHQSITLSNTGTLHVYETALLSVKEACVCVCVGRGVVRESIKEHIDTITNTPDCERPISGENECKKTLFLVWFIVVVMSQP